MKNGNKIFSNLLTKVFSENLIRSMIVSLSRKGEVSVKREMLDINKLDKKKNIFIKKTDSCITLNLDDSIRYLENQLKKDETIFNETRKEWLKILFFTQKNIKKLYELHEEPSNEKILNELLKEKEKI